jgi:hypothetical protein
MFTLGIIRNPSIQNAALLVVTAYGTYNYRLASKDAILFKIQTYLCEAIHANDSQLHTDFYHI